MMRKAKELEHCELQARDGVIGHVRDFLFDDESWTVRYLLVDTGPWLDRRRVMISPRAARGVDWQKKLVSVDLSQEQIRRSPPVDTQREISPEEEAALVQYYNWPAYWGAAGLPEVGMGIPLSPILPIHEPAHEAPSARAGAAVKDSHLRSVRAVTGHALEATDGSLGHVHDFLIDDQAWTIRYLVIDTRKWWPGKKILLAPQWIERVGWEEAKVYVELSREAVKASPPYDQDAPWADEYAGRLHRHYKQPPPTAFL